MKYWLHLILIFIISPANLYSQEEQILYFSKVLSEYKELYLFCPEGILDSNVNVLYVIDADQKSLWNEAKQNAQKYNFVLVGLPMGKTRDRDLVPENNDLLTENSQATIFYQFIHSELKCFIDSLFPYRCNEFLYGGSMGGLFASYVLLFYTDDFNGYIIDSPTLGHSSCLLNSRIRTLQQSENIANGKIVYFEYGVLDPLPSVNKYIRSFFTEIAIAFDAENSLLLIENQSSGHLPMGTLSRGIEYIYSEIKQ